jgi:C-terminal processing protease CtpA/Prc
MSAAALIGELCRWTDVLFPDPERGERLKAALLDHFGDDHRAVGADVCIEIEAIAQRFARHVALEYVPDGTLTPDVRAPGWEPQDPDAVRARAASVRLVERRGDGIGVLALDGLDRVDVAAPYVESAFAMLCECRGLVLDLRANGGGDPATVALVLDRLTGPDPIHVSDVVYRARTRQWWTAGGPQALPAATPVVALIGSATFSSGEALAYHLQSRGRARLVGQATPGAADHVTPIRVSTHVRALFPEAYVHDAVTRSNWEGVGVQPDLACTEDEALDRALELLGRR